MYLFYSLILLILFNGIALPADPNKPGSASAASKNVVLENNLELFWLFSVVFICNQILIVFKR